MIPRCRIVQHNCGFDIHCCLWISADILWCQLKLFSDVLCVPTNVLCCPLMSSACDVSFDVQWTLYTDVLWFLKCLLWYVQCSLIWCHLFDDCEVWKLIFSDISWSCLLMSAGVHWCRQFLSIRLWFLRRYKKSFVRLCFSRSPAQWMEIQFSRVVRVTNRPVRCSFSAPMRRA